MDGGALIALTSGLDGMLGSEALAREFLRPEALRGLLGERGLAGIRGLAGLRGLSGGLAWLLSERGLEELESKLEPEMSLGLTDLGLSALVGRGLR